MQNKLFTLPNLLTLAGLACGCAAVVFALTGEGRLDLVFLLVAAAAVFDFLDGLAARLTRQYSEVGKQLDSLADMVSFGVAPSAALYTIYTQAPALWAGAPARLLDALGWGVFAVALFSALRLARFNVDEDQREEFTGLPTPAAALAITALGLMWSNGSFAGVPREAILLGSAAVSCLLVCELRMFSLKFKGWGWRENALRYLFIVASAALVVMLGVAGVAAAIGLYIVASVVRAAVCGAPGRKND